MLGNPFAVARMRVMRAGSAQRRRHRSADAVRNVTADRERQERETGDRGNGRRRRAFPNKQTKQIMEKIRPSMTGIAQQRERNRTRAATSYLDRNAIQCQ